MANFRYRAANEIGETVSGIIAATTPAEACAKLREMHLLPEKVERISSPGGKYPALFGGGAAAHVAIFTRQCATLLATGVPLAEAIEVLAKQTEHRALSLALSEIQEAVTAGRSFAEALRAYPQFFDTSYVGMVASGEASGNMVAVLERLAEFLEKRRLMQARISTALIYPAILCALVIGVLLFLSGYVVPQIAPLLEQRGRPLPLTTWLLFRTCEFVRGWLWAFGGFLAVVLLALALGRHTRGGHRVLDLISLKMPLFGKLIKKSLISRFAMSFGTLLRSGVPATRALEIAAELLPSRAFAEDIQRIRQDVTEGKDLSSRMQSSSLFPPMVGYMVAVGERSGTLPDALEHLTRSYELELEIAARRLTAVLEPVLILVMAGVIGFIALSLMVSILELSHI